jgi:hypothetical protein
MTDYVTSLETALRDAAAREYPVHDERAESVPGTSKGRWAAPIRWRVRCGAWWRSPLALLLVVLAGASTAAAIVALNWNSAPLTGTVPGSGGRLRFDIPLTPDLEPGNVGWCSFPIFAITGTIEGSGGGTCSPAVARGAPVILGGAEPISNEQVPFGRAGRETGPERLKLLWMLVSSQVAAVRIDAHETVASRPDPRLPRSWRAVVAFTSVPLDQIRPVPLDRYGHAIAAPGASSGRLIPRGSGGVSPVRSYVPGSASPAPCSIGRVRAAVVTAQSEIVATGTPALGSRVAPGTLFSCARSWFSIEGQSQAPSAAVLLNAQDPRRPAPPLPGLTPTGQVGVFSDRSAELLAKRIGPAWLVVQSHSAAQATMLLGAIRVGGSAIKHHAAERAKAAAAD